MTTEEAIKFGNMWLEINEDCKDSNTYTFFQMAIKALEQQPCEDCISRQEAISAIQDEYYADETGIDIVDIIAHLPSVVPKPESEE